MKKAGVLFVLFLALSQGIYAQYTREDTAKTPGYTYHPPQPYSFWQHTTLGGNFGLQFGNYTLVALSPLLNYHFNQNFVLGFGPIYQYYSFTDPYYNYSTSGSIYGGRLVGMCYLPGSLSNVFLIGEYDIINVPYFDPSLYTYSRTTINIPLVGIGYRQRAGENLYFTLAGLWDLSGSPLSPYYNAYGGNGISLIPPVIEAGFDVGF